MVKSKKLPASAMARNSTLFFQHDTLLILPVKFMTYTVHIPTTSMTEYFTKYPYFRNQTTHLHGILKHHTVHKHPEHR
jgi:hypothetical protein